MKIQIIPTVILTLILLGSVSYLNADNHDTLYNASKTTASAKDDSSNAELIADIRNQLIGRWDNPFFSVESSENASPYRNGSLKYQFRADGTYSKTLGGAETRIEENGTWEISEDGKHLLMRSRSLCNGQEANVTQVATIKHLDLDELVLEQSICVDGVPVNSEPQDFYFNKY